MFFIGSGGTDCKVTVSYDAFGPQHSMLRDSTLATELFFINHRQHVNDVQIVISVVIRV